MGIGHHASMARVNWAEQAGSTRRLSIAEANDHLRTVRPLRPDGSNFPVCSCKSKRAGQVDVATFSVGWAFYLSDLKQIGLTLACLTLVSLPLIIYNIVESVAAIGMADNDGTSYVAYTTLFPTVFASAAQAITSSINTTVLPTSASENATIVETTTTTYLRIYEVEALYQYASLLPPTAEVNWWYITIIIINTCILVLFFARLNTGHRQRERLFAHSMTTPATFTVFVAGLPAAVTVDDLEAYFKQWGALAKICLHAVVDGELMALSSSVDDVHAPVLKEWRDRKLNPSIPFDEKDAAALQKAEDKCKELKKTIDDRWLDLLACELDIDAEEVSMSVSSPASTAGDEMGGAILAGETTIHDEQRLPQVAFISYMGSDGAAQCLHFFQKEKQAFRERNNLWDHVVLYRRRAVRLFTCGKRADWDCCTGNAEGDVATHEELGDDDDVEDVVDEDGEVLAKVAVRRSSQGKVIAYEALPATWEKSGTMVRSAVEPNDVVWAHVQYQGKASQLEVERHIRYWLSVFVLFLVVVGLGCLQCTYQFVVWGQHTSTIGDDLLVSIDWLAQFKYLPSTGAGVVLVGIAAGIGTCRFLTFALIVPQMNGVARYWSRSHWQRANFVWCSLVEFVWFLTVNMTTLGMMLILSATAANGDISGIEDASVIAQANINFWFIIFAMDISLFSLNQMGRIPVWAKRLVGLCCSKTQHELNLAWVQPADTPYWLYKNVVKVALIAGGLGAWAPAVYAGAMCELFVTFWSIRTVLTQFAAKPIMYRSFLGHTASKFYVLISLVCILSSTLFVAEASKRGACVCVCVSLSLCACNNISSTFLLLPLFNCPSPSTTPFSLYLQTRGLSLCALRSSRC